MGQVQSCNGRGKVLDGLGGLVGVHFGGLELWVGPVYRAAGPLSLCSIGLRWGPIISNELPGGCRGYAFWAGRLSPNRWG